MPVLIAILAAIGGLIWWWVRSNPRDALSIADDALTTARNAPRKIAFRRQTKEHPVQGVDDQRLAVATIAQAFIGLDDRPTRDDYDRLNVVLRKHYRLSAEDAEEMDALARFLIQECQGAQAAISRVGRRLYKIDGDKSWDDLSAVFSDLVTGSVSEGQQDAIDDLRNALKIRP